MTTRGLPEAKVRCRTQPTAIIHDSRHAAKPAATLHASTLHPLCRFSYGSSRLRYAALPHMVTARQPSLYLRLMVFCFELVHVIQDLHDEIHNAGNSVGVVVFNPSLVAQLGKLRVKRQRGKERYIRGL